MLLGVCLVLLQKSSYINKLLSEVKRLEKKDNVFDGGMTQEHDFIPVLVHEMRAPLSVIRGAADLLMKEAGELTVDQIHTLLAQIKTSTGGLLRIVNDILDVSKIGSGRFEINKVFANINDVLSEEAASFEPLAEVKKLKLDVNLESDVPKFSFDPDRVRQVMNNLLSNAIKYTPEDGAITVSSRKVKNNIEITIADTGLGVSDEEKPLLFHKFVQASNHTKIKEQGSGLGLVVCKGIVEAHKGNIWVEDNKPRGSKFVFDLPLS